MAEVDKFSLGSTFHAEQVLGWTAKTPMAEGLASTVEHIRRLSVEPVAA